MKTTPSLRTAAVRLAVVLGLGSGGFLAAADYQSTVLANSPVGYWRLNESVQPPAGDLARNSGSLGVAADGFYVAGAVHPDAGALIGNPSETGASFTGGARVSVPHQAALNPGGAFSVECWALKSTGTGYPLGAFSALRYVGGAEREGWLIYDNDTSWQFRIGDGAGYIATAGGGTADVGAWYHLVGVYDGENARLYVNGVEVQSVPCPRPFNGNTGWPTEIGTASAFSRHFSGVIDEAAIYPAALSAAEVLAHYQNGTSATPSTPYNQLVLAQNPLGYWRLNEGLYTPPTTLPPAANLATSGAAFNGSYNPGMQAGAPGPSFAGLGVGNLAGGINGLVGHVGTPVSLNGLSSFSLLGWIQRGTMHSARGGYFGQNDLLEFGDADGGANIEVWVNAFGTNIKMPYPFADNTWGFIAVVGEPTQVMVYTNGLLASSITHAAVTDFGASDYLVNIGGGGIFNATGDYFLGSIDEVAVFDKALTAQQIMDTFAAAAPPPWITQQPAAPARTVYAGNLVTLSVTAAGPPPITYQWRKGGVDLAGKTSTELAFSPITEADSGTYDVVAANAFGQVTSVVVTLDVQAAETTAPTLVYATGNALFNGVRVWFSEPLDPVSAQTASNYQLSDGVTVQSATLESPAGTPGDNIVLLTTTAQTPNHAYTLTVTGVKDQVVPANTITAGSTISFSSWVLSQGLLKFDVWNALSTTDNSLANTLLKDPTFPDSPDMSTFTTAFSTRPVYPDDSHEGYGGRMSGLLVPTATGDYRFFLYSDDSSRLYLSTTADPQAKTIVAEETDCCDVFQEPGTANDDGVTYPTSEPIHLVAGQQYYIEALWKEGTGGDYCQVAWRNETDATAAASLPVIPGQYLAVAVDPNIDLAFVTQPVDQVAVPATSSIAIASQDFNANDGGFTVVNTDPAPPGPWVYNSGSGRWGADGAESGCTGPYNSQLNSPTNTLAQAGAVMLTFSHRYSFESGLWDAGQVRISVNGGAFTLVPAENFITNGYAAGNIVGNGIANGQRAFNGDSPGYAEGTFITSQAILGTFNANDLLVVQFVGAWDDCSTQSVPGWEIDSLKLDLLVGAESSTFDAAAAATRQGETVAVSYQWQRNDGAAWADVPGATGTSFQIFPTEVDMRATFRVAASVYGVPGKVIYSNVVKLVTEAPPPTLAIAQSAGGITITYTGTLQSSATVNTGYQAVEGATSPYTVPTPTGTMFYRSMR